MNPALPRHLVPGDYAPWFKAPVLGGRADWSFSSAAGVPTLLFFFGSAANARIAGALAAIVARDDLFDDAQARFFGVTTDTGDVPKGRIAQRLPGIRYFIDYDRQLSVHYGAAAPGGDGYRPHLLLLDSALQVVGRYAIGEVDAALAALDAIVAPPQDWAPVLAVPRLLEPELCRALIAVYDSDGGADSGFMREVAGKTTTVLDHDFKRRRDAPIDDPVLRDALVQRFRRRLVPAIAKTFQFEATRIERYIVAAYDAGAGHFSPHRDNTTKGTAHRRFAVTINLNDDYEGGDLRFPEFGSRTYRAEPGGAVVFSCSLLHEATPVTRGRRYACLPFLYDDAAAKIRETNNAFLAGDVGRYAGPSV